MVNVVQMHGAKRSKTKDGTTYTYIYIYIYIYNRQIKQSMFLIFCFYLGYQWDEYWINDQSILVAIHHTNVWDNDVHWDVNGIMLFYTMPMFLKVDINGVHMDINGIIWGYNRT